MLDRGAMQSRAAITGRRAVCAALVATALALAAASAAGAFVQQGPKLVPSGLSPPSHAGLAVALSADGNTAIVGAPADNGFVGSAYVFSRSGGSWSEVQKLIPAGGEEIGKGDFGEAVAISADGSTVLVSAPRDSAKVGAAWIFVRSGSTWVQQGTKLTGDKEVGGGEFGIGVALSATGDTALIGGPADNGQMGAAWVYTRTGGSWTQQGAKLVAESGEIGTGEFGWSVALSADGNTALFGGESDDTSVGAGWVFTRSGATWTQQGPKLTGAGESGKANFGLTAALSADGNTALLGGPQDGFGKGAVWAFRRTGGSWGQVGEKLTPNDEVGSSRFGWSLGLSAAGDVALIGGPFDTSPAGAAWQFVLGPAGWTQQGTKIVPTEATTGHLGDAVALSGDGGTALLGAPEDGTTTGAAFAFVEPPPAATTGAASAVGTTTATLNGVFATGAAHAGYFQYGTSTAYGSASTAQAFGQSFLVSPPSIGAAVSGLVPGTTYHYRLVSESSGGASFGADQTFTTAPLPIPVCCAPAPRTPRISNVRQTRSRWREGSRAAAFARRRPPVGTTFTFALNVPASVTFAFTQRVGGRRVGSKCVAPNARNRRRRRCARTVTRGTLAFAGHPGTNKVTFAGLIRRGKRLPLGAYTLLISARSGAARSNTASLRFTIVR